LSRPYNIQDRTRDKLADLNKRVSNKKSRYRREKNIELNPLVQTIKPSEFTSRKQVEKYMRDMNRFLNRKTQFIQNESGKIFTAENVKRYYHKEIERINKQKEREFNRVKNLKIQVMGKELNQTLGERLKTAPENLFPNLHKLKGGLNRFSSEKEMLKVVKDSFQEGYFRGQFIKRTDRQYKRNFIESLDTVFGKKSARLKKYIQKMSLNDFMDVYYSTLGNIDIDYVYEDSENIASRLKVLERTFKL
jgi:hypothetical protein